MIKQAMILAAGFGKRVNPLTLKHPKPLLKIGNETLLSNTLKFLELTNIDQVVINVHYLSEQIVTYISKNKFKLDIKIIHEKDKILDTGGGVLNAIRHFSNKPFLIINPDTIWNSKYLEEVKLMEKKFFEDKKECFLLLVDKKKSFDKSFKGDFNLENNLIDRKSNGNLQYIYTGLQIINSDIFLNLNKKVFSINEIWNNLIKINSLNGLESRNDFFHVSNFDIYMNLLEKLKN